MPANITENNTGPSIKIIDASIISDIIGYLPILLILIIINKFSYFTYKF